MASYPISTLVFTYIPLEDALEKLAAAGFHEIEILANSLHLEDIERDPDGINQKLRDLNISVPVLHQPIEGINLGDTDQEIRRRSIERTIAAFRIADKLGASIVVVHPNSLISESDELTYDDSLANFTDSLAQLSDEAEIAGVKIAVENLPRSKADLPGATVHELLQIIDNLPEHVGICLDVGHSQVCGLDPVDEILETRDRLMALHLNDNRGFDDDHLIPGNGIIDWKSLLITLDRINFAGPRTLEFYGVGDKTMELLAQVEKIVADWKNREY